MTSSAKVRPEPLIRKLLAAETLTNRDHAMLTEMCGHPRYIEAG